MVESKKRENELMNPQIKSVHIEYSEYTLRIKGNQF